MAVTGTGKKRRRTVTTHSGTEALTLPTEKKEVSDSISEYVTMLYGRAGIGKTTLAASWPDCCMFSCERVSKGIPCFDFNSKNGGVTNWDIFRKGVDLLEEDGHRFKTCGIDTVDSAYQHCMAWVCAQDGVDHPSEGDQGKTWNNVKSEFLSQLVRIQNAGIGLVLTSHSKEIEIKTRAGDKYNRVTPSMTGQAYGVIKAITDLVCYAEYVKDQQGNTIRVLITQGDELIDAKSPPGVPLLLPMPFDGYTVLRDAVKGIHPGIPIESIYPSRSTTKAGIARVKKEKLTGSTIKTPKKKPIRKRSKT